MSDKWRLKRAEWGKQDTVQKIDLLPPWNSRHKPFCPTVVAHYCVAIYIRNRALLPPPVLFLEPKIKPVPKGPFGLPNHWTDCVSVRTCRLYRTHHQPVYTRFQNKVGEETSTAPLHLLHQPKRGKDGEDAGFGVK